MSNLEAVKVPVSPSSINRGFSDTVATNDRVVFWILAGYLGTLVMEGPIRFVLSRIGAGSVLYLRDVLMVAAVGLSFATAVLRGRSIITPVSVTLYALLLHMFIGLATGGSLFSVLFGLKVYFGFVFGLAAADSVQRQPTHFLYLIGSLWALCILGVMANRAVGVFPWTGLSYDTAFGTVEASKQWWTAGESRLAGFARASYDAAMVAGVGGIILVAILRLRLLRMVVIALSAAVIYLTTTKGMLMAFLVASMWLTVIPPGRWRVASGIAITMLFAILSIGLPVAVVGLDAADGAPMAVRRALYSLWDRFTFMWPQSFASLYHPVLYVTGKGLGSIGTPQVILGNPRASYGDNFFVYQFVVFGIFSLVYIATLTIAILRAFSRSEGERPWQTALLFILFIYGMTANMFEEQFFSILLGIATASSFAVLRTRSTVHRPYPTI